MTGFGFPSRFKLKKTDEFSSVFNFRKRITGDMLAIHYMPNALGQPRLGLVVSKKIAKRAVHRNYMKRLLRELFRHESASMGSVDLIVRPMRAFTRDDYLKVKLEFTALLEKMQRRQAR